MSYDIRFCVKVDGTDIFAVIGEPEYADPTYNLANMFRACTGWDYVQGECYQCSEVMPMIDRGIRELRVNREKYTKYLPENGWGTIGSAIQALESMRDGIYETVENQEIPIEHLYVRW